MWIYAGFSGCYPPVRIRGRAVSYRGSVVSFAGNIQSVRIPKTGTRRCICDKPCTDSSYGKCVYTYPDKNFRLYPGIPRDTEHWKHIYSNRVTVERTINLLKDTFALADNKSYSVITLKADLFLSGIVQLIGVILADKLNKHHLFKSIRKLLA